MSASSAIGAAVVIADRGGGIEARGFDAATFPAPGLEPLADGDDGDQEGGDRIKPPGPEQSIAEQAEEDGAGEVGAEHVLGALAVGRLRAELAGDPLLGAAEQRHPIRLDAVNAMPRMLTSTSSAPARWAIAS